MTSKSFPDFGQKLGRPSPVHEYCYDCVEFYHGCHAWPEKQPFDCADYYRLPDVMPGTCGPIFPPSRMKGRKDPMVHQKTVGDGQEDSRIPSPTPTRKRPAESDAKPRLCECGAALPKSKRLCDACRTKKRRQTKTGYMRGYMQQRRSGVSGLV